ncbi:MAG: polyribonucleotide nucleotidyltransferase [Deltaproteobacteria bacterium]|nr:polyribonucleotide nucleotidyltransferase [Deltaproteobacteria bacterium]MBW2070778.1 polyribonucleotide nucleotidyltransferase [Deltaproteobacteria bacterium]
MKETVEVELGGRRLRLETGEMAKQASGAVLVSYGDTVVLVTAVGEDRTREGIDFVPLNVEYQEKGFAAGRIPGGFFRREIGRPSERETLVSRLIDRPIRPLFPKHYRNETQVIATVLSADAENDPDVVAMVGASAALEISGLPFAGPIGAVRVGRINGKFVVNPGIAEAEESDINMIIAGNRQGIVMVEGSASFVKEDELIEALFFGHEQIQPILDIQEILKSRCGKEGQAVASPETDEELAARVVEIGADGIREANAIPSKQERYARRKAVFDEVMERLGADFAERQAEVNEILHDLERQYVRDLIVRERKRIDGRGLRDIRPVDCRVGLLPRTHGSGLFTRGETQVLSVVTLGSSADEQKIEALAGETYKSFMLHYNFPPYCVGEARFLRGPSRREIGHGALAERTLKAVMPSHEDFPYTVRVVAEVLESNGSSSMASVCASSLGLMDAGVPLKSHVAGIAMGLIMEKGEVAVLSDILGDEDHLGDMDFKIAGSATGVVSLQMDIKVTGVPREVMRQALMQAREGRLHILEQMNRAIAEPRKELSPYAPRIITMEIHPDKIRDVIGPGGKVIRSIIAETNTKIDIEDSGKVVIMSPDLAACDKAVEMIKGLTAEAQVGNLYLGKVRKITDFGAFVEILPGTDGLIHISQLDHKRVQRVRDILNEGDEVLVKVLDIDKDGRIRLSRKAALGESLSKTSDK